MKRLHHNQHNASYQQLQGRGLPDGQRCNGSQSFLSSKLYGNRNGTKRAIVSNEKQKKPYSGLLQLSSL
jgi:hypothetical protein